MTARRWTLASLERACRKVFSDRTKLKLVKLPSPLTAHVEWVSNGRASVQVDPHEVTIRMGVLHELLHVVLQDHDDPFPRLDPELSEACIEGLESLMERFISESPGRKSWWRKAIDKKL